MAMEKYPLGRELWRQPMSRWLLGIPLGGVAMFIVGILFWGAFNWSIELSSTELFCANSCHEMTDFVALEWKESIHYSNASGVRAACADCHVPKPWAAKVARKIRATNELFHKIMGTINTREKFEAKRLELAEHVWDSMMASDSRECRNCHKMDFMDMEAQDRYARRKHERGIAEGQTCIECHKGIAHKLPEGVDDSIAQVQ